MSGQQCADLLLVALLCDLHKFRFFDEHAADVSHDVIVDLYQLIVWYQHDKSHRDLFEIRIFNATFSSGMHTANTGRVTPFVLVCRSAKPNSARSARTPAPSASDPPG